jgi:hypothetical protein
MDPGHAAAVVVDPRCGTTVVVEFQGAHRPRHLFGGRGGWSHGMLLANLKMGRSSASPLTVPPPRNARDLLPWQLLRSTQHHGLAPLALTGDAYQSFPSTGMSFTQPVVSFLNVTICLAHNYMVCI